MLGCATNLGYLPSREGAANLSVHDGPNLSYRKVLVSKMQSAHGFLNLIRVTTTLRALF